jgi:hypothetical protein
VTPCISEAAAGEVAMDILVSLADAVWNPRDVRSIRQRRELATYRPGHETDDLMASLDRYPDDQVATLRDRLFFLAHPLHADDGRL